MSKNANPKTSATKTENHIPRPELIAALNELFADPKSGWEIPDDSLVGPFKAKLDQLKARVDSLTDELLAIKGQKPEPKPAERIDASASVKASTKKK